LANSIVAGLIVVGATDLWSIVANLHRASLVSGFASNPLTISLPAAHHADNLVDASSIVNLLALLVVGVLFIIWLHEIVSDLHKVRPGVPRYSPGWAVGGWFIPVFNLVRPKQVVDDAWQSSAPGGGRQSQVPLALNLWWAGWILHGVVAWIGLVMGHHSPTALAHHDRVYALSHGVDIVVVFLAIMVVRALTSRVEAASSVDPRSTPHFINQFNPPPGWPTPPSGWAPPLGWVPDPAWPPAPANWQFWKAAPAWQPERLAWQAASLNWEYWTS
jgi:hypothetical protein